MPLMFRPPNLPPYNLPSLENQTEIQKEIQDQLRMYIKHINKPFDSNTALCGIYLWIIFGYMSVFMNCDLHRFMKSYPMFMHTMGLIAVLFLFTLQDQNNDSSNIPLIYLKTVFVYLLFILMMRSKWYFVLPVLMVLLVDQTIRKDTSIKLATGEKVDEIARDKITSWLRVTVVVLIIVGALQYMVLQKRKHKEAFSLFEFLFGFGQCGSTNR